MGFKRGAYNCECSKGYYFPDKSASMKAFSGLEIENIFANNVNSSTLYIDQYRCLPCKEGCSECVDDSPCLYEFLFVFRFLVLLVTMVTCVLIGVLSAVTAYFRAELVCLF